MKHGFNIILICILSVVIISFIYLVSTLPAMDMPLPIQKIKWCMEYPIYATGLGGSSGERSCSEVQPYKIDENCWTNNEEIFCGTLHIYSITN
jgi:hypothetical protein